MPPAVFSALTFEITKQERERTNLLGTYKLADHAPNRRPQRSSHREPAGALSEDFFVQHGKWSGMSPAEAPRLPARNTPDTAASDRAGVPRSCQSKRLGGGDQATTPRQNRALRRLMALSLLGALTEARDSASTGAVTTASAPSLPLQA
jgi:hypothetical protein